MLARRRAGPPALAREDQPSPETSGARRIEDLSDPAVG
jgi:hypothetical protein